MKTLCCLNRAALAVACVTLIITTTSVKAAFPSVSIVPIHANAGVTAVLAGTTDPTVFIATATGVVQTTLLGTCVEIAQLQVRFPTTSGQPVVLNWTVTGASYFVVSPQVGAVRGNTVTVYPTVTTTYALYATNQYHRSKKTVTVTIQ